MIILRAVNVMYEALVRKPIHEARSYRVAYFCKNREKEVRIVLSIQVTLQWAFTYSQLIRSRSSQCNINISCIYGTTALRRHKLAQWNTTIKEISHYLKRTTWQWYTTIISSVNKLCSLSAFGWTFSGLCVNVGVISFGGRPVLPRTRWRSTICRFGQFIEDLLLSDSSILAEALWKSWIQFLLKINDLH